MANQLPANRERIEASVDIDAAPADVWKVVSDLRRMGEWSPQCRKMFVFGGDVKQGTRTLNLNRQGWKWWPTNAVVEAFEPEKKLALRIVENRSVWTYELELTATGTRLTEARSIPNGVSGTSKFLTKVVLGGPQKFEDELQAGIESTLQRIKAEVERAA
ncbi:MAG TPA: SRPBCC family protein [Aeromicrobium sp.]|nr:SRPBCC family protein [Aeromicrobium sp.]